MHLLPQVLCLRSYRAEWGTLGIGNLLHTGSFLYVILQFPPAAPHGQVCVYVRFPVRIKSVSLSRHHSSLAITPLSPSLTKFSETNTSCQKKKEEQKIFQTEVCPKKEHKTGDGGVNVSWRNEVRVECVLSISVESVFAYIERTLSNRREHFLKRGNGGVNVPGRCGKCGR